MKRSFSLFILIFFLLIGVSGCTKNDYILLFNHKPITKETVLKNSKDFSVGEKIYYIFISQKPLKSNYIRIYVKKEDENAGYFGEQTIYGNDHRLYKDQVYYFNDYIVFHERGHYLMLVYLRDNDYKPLACADFYVR